MKTAGEFYHGTSGSFATDILRDGLIPPSKRPGFAGGAGVGDVWVSTDRLESLSWGLRKARQTQDDTIALVVFSGALPSSGANHVFWTSRGIAAKRIARIEFFDTKAVGESISTNTDLPEPIRIQKVAGLLKKASMIDSNGWITPEGNFDPLQDNETHVNAIQRLLDRDDVFEKDGLTEDYIRVHYRNYVRSQPIEVYFLCDRKTPDNLSRLREAIHDLHPATKRVAVVFQKPQSYEQYSFEEALEDFPRMHVTSSLLKKAELPEIQKLDAPTSKEYDAVRWVYQWYHDNRVDSLSWKDFQKRFQQFAQKYPQLFTEVRQNRPHITRSDLDAWLEQAKPDQSHYKVEYDKYEDAGTSFRDVEQLVLQINQGANAEQVLGSDPLLKEYINAVSQSGAHAGHPVGQQTVGWLRVDFIDEDWLLVDEVQSDLVNSVAQAKSIVTQPTFDAWINSLTNEKVRRVALEKVNEQMFDGGKRYFREKGYTLERLDEIKEQLVKLFADWAEYGIATLIEIARRHGIKNVAIHTAESIAQRDESVEPDKVQRYYDSLAKSFGFRKQQLDVGELKGNFWVRTAANTNRFYPANDEWVNRAKEFLKEKWAQRHRELGREGEPTDLSGACKFGSMLAKALFGGRIVGNPEHQILKLPTRMVDLTDLWNPETFHHDKEFFGNPEHTESMVSCESRVQLWVHEFKKRYGAASKTSSKKAAAQLEKGWLTQDGVFYPNGEAERGERGERMPRTHAESAKQYGLGKGFDYKSIVEDAVANGHIRLDTDGQFVDLQVERLDGHTRHAIADFLIEQQGKIGAVQIEHMQPRVNTVNFGAVDEALEWLEGTSVYASKQEAYAPPKPMNSALLKAANDASGAAQELARNGGWIGSDGQLYVFTNPDDDHGYVAYAEELGDLDDVERALGNTFDSAEISAKENGCIRVEGTARDQSDDGLDFEMDSLSASRHLLAKVLRQMDAKNITIEWWKPANKSKTFETAEQAAEWLESL